MNLPQAIEGYFIAANADLSPTTAEIYRWAFKFMIQRLGPDKPVEKITEQELLNLFTWLRTEYTPQRRNGNTAPLSGRSLENIWTAMRSFFNWAEHELKLTTRPDYAVKRPRYAKRKIEVLTDDEIRKLLAAAERTKIARTSNREPFTMRRKTAARDRALILLLLDTGIRVGECARLQVEDVDLNTGTVYIEPFGTGRKTISRTVYLGRAAKKAVWRYLNTRPDLRPADPLFLTEEEKPMDRNSIRLLITHLGKAAGVAHCHPHRFRHTFCYQYIRNGGDPFTLQRLAGWASLDMAVNYVHMAGLDAQLKHNQASPVDNWRL